MKWWQTIILLTIVIVAIVVSSVYWYDVGTNVAPSFSGWTAWIDLNHNIHVETADGDEWIYPMSIDEWEGLRDVLIYGEDYGG